MALYKKINGQLVAVNDQRDTFADDWDRKSREEKARIIKEAGLTRNPDTKWKDIPRSDQISIIGAW